MNVLLIYFKSARQRVHVLEVLREDKMLKWWTDINHVTTLSQHAHLTHLCPCCQSWRIPDRHTLPNLYWYEHGPEIISKTLCQYRLQGGQRKNINILKLNWSHKNIENCFLSMAILIISWIVFHYTLFTEWYNVIHKKDLYGSATSSLIPLIPSRWLIFYNNNNNNTFNKAPLLGGAIQRRCTYNMSVKTR